MTRHLRALWEKRVLPTLWLVLIAAPSGSSAQEQSSYTRHVHGWAIEYPSNWSIDTSDANFVKIEHPSGTALCGFQSGSTEITSVKILVEKMLDYESNNFRAQGKLFASVVDRGKIEAPPKVAGIRVLLDLNPGGRSLRHYFIYSGNFLIADCETYQKNWASIESDFEHILKSISFQKTEAAIDYDAGLAALQSGNLGKAVDLFLKSAKGGDSRGQYSIGVLLDEGRGIEKDTRAATAWLLKASEQGQLEAQVRFWQIRLGSGFLSRPDAEEAFFWLRKAAEQGDIESQFQLAIQLQAGGPILKQNVAEALHWFDVVARQGIPQAQHAVGAILLDGVDGQTNVGAAYGWLSLAVANGQKSSEEMRQKAAALLSPEDRAALDAKVSNCLTTQYRECGF